MMIMTALTVSHRRPAGDDATPEERSFWRKLMSRRYDPLDWLVYADWLQDQGDEDSAEYVREYVREELVRPGRDWHDGRNPRPGLVHVDELRCGPRCRRLGVPYALAIVGRNRYGTLISGVVVREGDENMVRAAVGVPAEATA